jgi:endonuclease YncB( thermonuclease family)
MEEEDTNPSSSQSKTKLSETTLPIRFYGIDTPEIAKDGNPGMAHADDATHYTKRKISESGQIVNVKILSKDRYDRIVGVVTTTNPPGFDLSKGLASEGLASLYNGKGAEYDGKRQDLMMAIQTAQRMKKGIWENGILGVQSPAEYKKMIKTRSI